MNENTKYLSLPAPLAEEFKRFWDDTTPFTLKNMMDLAIHAVKFGEQHPENKIQIAESLHEIVFEYFQYPNEVDDTDLYTHRYSRLLPDIEKLTEQFSQFENDKFKLDTEWVKLKWLIEDQLKIIS
ncbi:MAG TPA: hypothetical protein VK983_01585 [Candidatus Limnocylindrales bacterium]|nr:hypothetical protein [Candidatus Limnocylindrales bacterium]